MNKNLHINSLASTSWNNHIFLLLKKNWKTKQNSNISIMFGSGIIFLIILIRSFFGHGFGGFRSTTAWIRWNFWKNTQCDWFSTFWQNRVHVDYWRGNASFLTRSGNIRPNCTVHRGPAKKIHINISILKTFCGETRKGGFTVSKTEFNWVISKAETESIELLKWATPTVIISKHTLLSRDVLAGVDMPDICSVVELRTVYQWRWLGNQKQIPSMELQCANCQWRCLITT